MKQNELIINFLNETRRRSILLWKVLPEGFYDWGVVRKISLVTIYCVVHIMNQYMLGSL